MRRAIAKGRVFPQSYSTDRRYGRLSLKAVAIFPLMWSNSDDQGRLCGDPDEIKYACCPNIDHITKQDIPAILKELEVNNLILRYDTPKSAAIQMLDWWDEKRAHSLQWAWPSEYPSPEGWRDHLRYKKSAKEVATLNWPVSPESSPEDSKMSHLSIDNGSGECSGDRSGESSAEQAAKPPDSPPSPTPSSPPYPPGTGTGNGTGNGRGNSPEDSGEKQPPTERKIATGKDIPRSRTEAVETLCEGDREVISVWCSVKGFKMAPADASALVAQLRTEFPDVDILDESKAWAARKLSEPLTKTSRPSGQLWNFMKKRRKWDKEKRGEYEQRESKGREPPAHKPDPLQAFRDAGGTVILSGEEAEDGNEDR